MIKSLEVKNFKSHKDTNLSIGALTLLCGPNGVGKSSIIQVFLLMRQTFLKNRLDEVLSLNSPLCNLGKSKDVSYLNGGQDIEFVMQDNKHKYQWRFDVSKDLDFLQRINKGPKFEKNNANLPFFTNDFHYLSAYRSAESSTDDYAVQIQKQLSVEEGKGELTAQFLFEYGKSVKVDPALCHPMESDPFLLSQATSWEREVSENVNVIPVKIGEGYEIKYSFDTQDFGPTDEYSPKNVGFGLSYVLPLIVAVLSSKPGALLILENPEAHLHPQAQSKIAELICIAAQAGIQIIVETHSDHIINGVLVNCKKFEEGQGGIQKEKVSIYHFSKDDMQPATQTEKINIEDGGRVRYTPKGFFDQFTIDRKYLMGF